MSLSKVCVFTTLVAVVALAAGRRLDHQAKGLGALIANSARCHPAADLNKSLWPPDHSEKKPVQSNWVFDPRSEDPLPISFPVQSKNPEDLGAGRLLVASRTLADPNFVGTVVLLVHCDADGVVGLILNRHTNVPLSRVLDQFEAAKERTDTVYLGGPVETPAVFALLRSTVKPDGAEQVFGGAYLISTKAVFEKAISARPDPAIFHVYLGYAGWSNDQLRKEVEQGSWFIFQGDTGTVFDSDPDSLWRQMIERTEFRLARSEPADAQSRTVAFEINDREY